MRLISPGNNRQVWQNTNRWKRISTNPKQTSRPARHYFFLNPYQDCAFTKYPKCDSKTRVRKYPLVIHVEPEQILNLNKTCKYCTECDLIIVKQADIEALMTACLENERPSIIGNDYLVRGPGKRYHCRGPGHRSARRAYCRSCVRCYLQSNADTGQDCPTLDLWSMLARSDIQI